MKNPNWHRDEIILALDLYFNKDRESIDDRNPKVIELSELLNKLPIYLLRPDKEKFRNPNGVVLKLSNFLPHDPEYKGKGMEGGSKLDKEIFNEFYSDRLTLRKLANEIKFIILNSELSKKIAEIEDDENSELDRIKEGQVLYKLHKVRERARKIILAKKRKVMKEKGKLECEVCGFNFEYKYGEIGAGFIECHHIVPLSKFDKIIETRLEDLALVCSNCHSMLHRSITNLDIEQFKNKIKIM